MTLHIDKAGRLVLPKPVRDRFGLHEGSRIELIEGPDGVTLKPVEAGPSMVMKRGLWVHMGRIPTGFDTVEAIREDREDRVRALGGL